MYSMQPVLSGHLTIHRGWPLNTGSGPYCLLYLTFGYSGDEIEISREVPLLKTKVIIMSQF